MPSIKSSILVNITWSSNIATVVVKHYLNQDSSSSGIHSWGWALQESYDAVDVLFYLEMRWAARQVPRPVAGGTRWSSVVEGWNQASNQPSNQPGESNISNLRSRVTSKHLRNKWSMGNWTNSWSIADVFMRKWMQRCYCTYGDVEVFAKCCEHFLLYCSFLFMFCGNSLICNCISVIRYYVQFFAAKQTKGR